MTSRPRSAWSPLSYPIFRALWIATVASHIGSYMTDVGQGWLMSTLTPSPLIVSLLLTAESLPFFALGLPAGALADILDRRRLLIVTQGAMTVVVGTLAVVTFTGVVTPWMLLALALALGTATALNDPAWHSIVPETLPSEELTAGVTLAGAGVNVARTLGPALGGFLVAAAGPGVVFALDAVSFLAVVGVLLAWKRTPTPTVLPHERMLAAIRAGLRFARHSQPLRSVLLATFLFMMCGAGIMALMPVLGRETGRGAVGFGLLLGSLGVGAVAGAAFLPRVRSRVAPERLVAAGSLAFAAVAVGAATLRQLHLLCPTLLVGGVAWISVLSTLNVAAQHASPPWVKARALAVYLIVFQAGIAGGSALWGLVASHSGLDAAYFGIAGGMLLGAALAVRLKPASGEAVDHTPAHHWPDPVVAGEPSLEAGPIMVQVEYRVNPSNAEAFRGAMAEVGRNRRRDGAVQWWLFQDTADPTRFVETWIEATWAEHLRYHERVSVAHKEIEERVRSLIRSGSTTETRHFIAPGTRPSAKAVVRVVEERAGG
ncbi:MAG: MFS transporter [Planctomycetes bacterium]|nr:MFS transporter [Planctomycetota bacterium]